MISVCPGRAPRLTRDTEGGGAVMMGTEAVAPARLRAAAARAGCDVTRTRVTDSRRSRARSRRSNRPGKRGFPAPWTDNAMTDDRSAKKAARARMAATGEPYSTARRAVQTGPDRPAPLARPPAIDPREHAMHSRHWGVLACYLVRYEGRYSAWITSADPGDPGQAYGMPSEAAGRAFVDAWQTTNLLHTPRNAERY